MADDKIFDTNIPAPSKIELTFGEEGSPSIASVTDAAEDAAKTAEDAASSAAETVKEAAGTAAGEAAQTVSSLAQEAADAVSEGTGAAAAQAAQEFAGAAAASTQAAQSVADAADAAAQAVQAVAEAEHLTEEEQKMVDEFAEKIDIHNSNAILQYGAGTQKKMSDFTDQALDSVRNKDMGEVGEMISGLVTQLKDFDIEEDEGGFFKFFKKQGNKLVALQNKYEKTEKSVDDIIEVLEGHQVQLLKDVATLDQMYDLNLNYFKELTMYIAAGKKRLKEVREGELKALQDKAAETGDAQDAQNAKDFGALCDRFEKKLHDLELTRQIAIQTGPQIRLVQDSDTLMAEKIQSTIVNTIPLWKNQMVIALGVEHSAQAAKAQKEVSELTNELLKKNAQQLHTASVETAKESERGIVDIETLKTTNAELITTLDEVLKIQEEGRAKRRLAEEEMAKMETELKGKLLDLSRSSK